MTDSLVYCIVCAALLSGVLGTPFRVLHLYSVGYDVEESAISVEQFADSNQSLLQVYNITVENVEDVEVSIAKVANLHKRHCTVNNSFLNPSSVMNGLPEETSF